MTNDLITIDDSRWLALQPSEPDYQEAIKPLSAVSPEIALLSTPIKHSLPAVTWLYKGITHLMIELGGIHY